eukprot:TRINITY_DN87_c0_g1_i6.p1 TRINITY_DN87_c0_g1~~TRINITY_DN87_c0_g1_i6.p1  ORF type:complete len:526 (-),score=124.48 TRINITY_DN87_c0_g1_i6:336-1913(-)
MLESTFWNEFQCGDVQHAVTMTNIFKPEDQFYLHRSLRTDQALGCIFYPSQSDYAAASPHQDFVCPTSSEIEFLITLNAEHFKVEKKHGIPLVLDYGHLRFTDASPEVTMFVDVANVGTARGDFDLIKPDCCVYESSNEENCTRIPNSGSWEFSLDPFETERHIVILGNQEIHNKYVSCFINIYQGSALEVSISARFVPTANVIPTADIQELRSTTDYGLYGTFDDYCEEDETWSDAQYSCVPIDCYLKYGDESPFFDESLRKCVPIEECEDGEFYQDWTNACFPMEMEDLDDDDESDEYTIVVIDCIHGVLTHDEDNGDDYCVCDFGWRTTYDPNILLGKNYTACNEAIVIQYPSDVPSDEGNDGTLFSSVTLMAIGIGLIFAIIVFYILRVCCFCFRDTKKSKKKRQARNRKIRGKKWSLVAEKISEDENSQDRSKSKKRHTKKADKVGESRAKMEKKMRKGGRKHYDPNEQEDSDSEVSMDSSDEQTLESLDPVGDWIQERVITSSFDIHVLQPSSQPSVFD